MAKIWSILLLTAAVAGSAMAQEHYTEGPVWRVSLIKVKPNKMDEYLASLRQASKPLFDEQKRNGTIMDYKIFLKETSNGPQDWDIAVAIQYKNHAALDGLAAKGEAARDKILGGKRQAQEIGDKRQEIRELITSDLLQEITLK